MKKGGGGGGGGERAVAKGGGEEGVGEGVAVERETGRQTTASRRGEAWSRLARVWPGMRMETNICGVGMAHVQGGGCWPHSFFFSFSFHFIFSFPVFILFILKQFSISKYSNEKRYLRNHKMYVNSKK